MDTKKALNWLLAIIWMGIIFYISGLSLVPASQINVLDFIFKKTAHIIEYMILFVLLHRAFGFRSKNSLANSFSIALLYAFLDETHQLFTPGRGGLIRDVGFDLTGLILGVLLRKNKI